MPINNELVPKKHPMNLLFGQKPLTKFKDYRKSIKVDLIKWDNPDEMLRGTYDFVKATWSKDGKESERATKEEMEHALEQMLSGKALGLGLETVNFMFRISGITRLDTHQIVRNRIGITYSQMCSGDQWWSHRDCLVEECIAKDESLLDSFIETTLSCKNTYTKMIDEGISIQAARSVLPHNLDTFIFANCNLMTLLFFHQKRIDIESQTWQINEIAQQMADQVCEKFPSLNSTFEKNKKKFKFQEEAGKDRGNTFSTGLYIPENDTFDYTPRDFVYPKTKKEMHYTNTPIEPQYYWGLDRVTEQAYNRVKEVYSELDEVIKTSHLSNEEISQRAKELTKNLENEIEQG